MLTFEFPAFYFSRFVSRHFEVLLTKVKSVRVFGTFWHLIESFGNFRIVTKQARLRNHYRHHNRKNF